MRAIEALNCLGANRTIWIDDIFSEGPNDLASLIMNNREIAIECGFEEIAPYLEAAEYEEEKALADLTECLNEIGPIECEKIRQGFFAKQSEMGHAPSDEMSSHDSERVCKHLAIAGQDRWNFDKALENLPALCAGDDSNVSYIVDLKEAGGSPTRGLEILKLLWERHSKGFAFILTHEVVSGAEADKEAELRQRLLDEDADQLGIPVCVISKEGIQGAQDDNSLEQTLSVSIKRAALRRSLSDVLTRASGAIHGAFHHAASSLLNIAPEHLEAYVFERGYKEGVSELHVVERILSSHISKEIRSYFGTNLTALDSVKRLRSLRSVPLMVVAKEPDESLAAFRLSEVWESAELINNALTPIACGDVFEADPYESSVNELKKKFIVLAQPCDIAMRPEQDRDMADALFVPLVTVGDDYKLNIKKPKLPSKVDDKYWACDFRSATQVRLNILDLASFRSDGRVRLDDGHAADGNLFAALSRVYKRRTAPAAKALAKGLQPTDEETRAALQLTFDSKGPFSRIYRPRVENRSRENGDANIPALPKRITWGLVRRGRVRIPYSVALLDQYLEVMGRHAFDLDYIAPGFEDGTAKESEVREVIETSEPPAKVEGFVRKFMSRKISQLLGRPV